MTNLFLKVNKDLFKLGLNPTEVIILAQVMEFNTNTGDCYMSNEQFAEMLSISVSTVKRAMDKIENMGFIKRDTKASQKGKERHIKVNLDKVEEALAKSKMNLAEDTNNSAKSKMNLPQGSKCPLRKEQNEPIKDNREEDNLKDNMEIESSDEDSISKDSPEAEEIKVDGEITLAEYESKKEMCEVIGENLIKTPIGKILRIKEHRK